jgi:tetratricopeptide (TPR) repeat protein
MASAFRPHPGRVVNDFRRTADSGIIYASMEMMSADATASSRASGPKGGRLVSERKNRVIAAGWGVLVVGLCLLPGCTPQPPVTGLFLDAVALRELGQNELAISKLNAVVAADPDFALAYAELGKAYQATGDQAKALAAFEQAVKLAPWSAGDHLNLARLCESLGEYPRAAQVYARAAELDPKSFAALKGAAECCLKTGQYAKSLTYCELAEKAGIEPKEMLLLLARVYEAQNDYELAIQAYRRLLVLDDDDPNVLRPLGVAYVKARQYDRARQVLVAVAQRRPEDGAVLRDLGYCLAKLGDVDQAMEIYRKSVELDANDWEAHRGLGVACMLKAHQMGDGRLREEALRHWRHSLVLKPDQPKREVLERLIRAHAESQNSLEGLND